MRVDRIIRSQHPCGELSEFVNRLTSTCWGCRRFHSIHRPNGSLCHVEKRVKLITDKQTYNNRLLLYQQKVPSQDLKIPNVWIEEQGKLKTYTVQTYKEPVETSIYKPEGQVKNRQSDIQCASIVPVESSIARPDGTQQLHVYHIKHCVHCVWKYLHPLYGRVNLHSPSQMGECLYQRGSPSQAPDVKFFQNFYSKIICWYYSIHVLQEITLL